MEKLISWMDTTVLTAQDGIRNCIFINEFLSFWNQKTKVKQVFMFKVCIVQLCVCFQCNLNSSLARAELFYHWMFEIQQAQWADKWTNKMRSMYLYVVYIFFEAYWWFILFGSKLINDWYCFISSFRVVKILLKKTTIYI